MVEAKHNDAEDGGHTEPCEHEREPSKVECDRLSKVCSDRVNVGEEAHDLRIYTTLGLRVMQRNNVFNELQSSERGQERGTRVHLPASRLRSCLQGLARFCAELHTAV